MASPEDETKITEMRVFLEQLLEKCRNTPGIKKQKVTPSEKELGKIAELARKIADQHGIYRSVRNAQEYLEK